MHVVNVKEAREQISRLLDEVMAGGEVIIARRGRKIARLCAISETPKKFSDRTSFRAKIPPCKVSSTESIRKLRDEERY